MTNSDLTLQRIATEFDDAWRICKRGEIPDILSFFHRVPEEQKVCLAELLIPVDVKYRTKAGIRITPGDYLRVCPGGDAISRRVLDAMQSPNDGQRIPLPNDIAKTITQPIGTDRFAITQSYTASPLGHFPNKGSFPCPGEGQTDKVRELKPESLLPDSNRPVGLDSEEYRQACEWFHFLLRLDSSEGERHLSQLRIRSPLLAVCVAQLLEADKEAEEAGFLDTPVVEGSRIPEGGHSTTSLPQTIGGYKIISEIGRGGMGVVYRAFDEKGSRFIALKAIRSGFLSGPEEVERFRREAISTCQLDHPNIVRTYFVGTDRTTDFFTMELVEGQNLQTILRNSGIRTKEAVKLVRKIALALDYAHSKGIIHRDVKPGNILLDQTGEAKLVDFGLAKCPDTGGIQTRSEQLLGTVNYMAPEQISKAKTAGPTADIYGLGATLYHCLTGVPPISGDDLISTLQRLKDTQPLPLRAFRDDIDRDLELICLRCLQKAPNERYQSARQLADDLQLFLDGKPISFAPSAWWNSVARQIKRDELTSQIPSASAAIWLALFTLLFHAAVFSIIRWDFGSPYLWVAVGVWFIAANLVNYIFHWSQFWQLSGLERQSGIIQLGVNLSFLFLFLIHGPFSMERGPNPNSHPFLNIYPPFTLIAAVALMAHGKYFGQILFPALSLFPLAIAISYFPLSGPLLFATFGAAILVWSARILRQPRG